VPAEAFTQIEGGHMYTWGLVKDVISKYFITAKGCRILLIEFFNKYQLIAINTANNCYI